MWVYVVTHVAECPSSRYKRLVNISRHSTPTIAKHTSHHIAIMRCSCDAGPLALSFACFANFAACNASVAPTLELPAALTAARARQRRVSTSGLLAAKHGEAIPWMADGCRMLCRVKFGNCAGPGRNANVQQFSLVQYIVALCAQINIEYIYI